MSTSGELIVVPNKTKEVFSSSQSSLSQLSNLRKNTTFGLSKVKEINLN